VTASESQLALARGNRVAGDIVLGRQTKKFLQVQPTFRWVWAIALVLAILIAATTAVLLQLIALMDAVLAALAATTGAMTLGGVTRRRTSVIESAVAPAATALLCGSIMLEVSAVLRAPDLLPTQDEPGREVLTEYDRRLLIQIDSSLQKSTDVNDHMRAQGIKRRAAREPMPLVSGTIFIRYPPKHSSSYDGTYSAPDPHVIVYIARGCVSSNTPSMTVRLDMIQSAREMSASLVAMQYETSIKNAQGVIDCMIAKVQSNWTSHGERGQASVTFNIDQANP